jgi:hypothetical protein
MPTLIAKPSNVRARYMERLEGKIDEAVRAVRMAQEELTVAVDALVSLGDKRMVTPALELCLEKVRTAQSHVCDLQRLLARA